MSKPLKLILSGDGELLDVAIRLESDQMVGIKLAGNRTIFRKPPNYRTERSITFSYMAPGHGLVLDIEYSANAPITFSISGPVNGMKNAVQQQILFDVDIENSRRLRRQRLAETLKLWLGGLMMASSTVFMVFDASTGGHAISSRGWTYWLTMGVMAIGEWLAIVAWHRLKQPKKVPATLRYWEPATKTRPIPIIDRATAE
ncbi:hypothetical protein G3N96_23255 [Burkholderia sp. Se-20373]|uniref:hypothetical protein n=1 Tax=Burkholderia sp. Se-20373 TaxID=2703898 RepID=UPI0019826ACB|nr:hypothetical protein [Burkholderia sp. Se-20373]MBN3748318.1 hypothetical protein [Burkholderia sp. Se-20373]